MLSLSFRYLSGFLILGYLYRKSRQLHSSAFSGFYIHRLLTYHHILGQVPAFVFLLSFAWTIVPVLHRFFLRSYSPFGQQTVSLTPGLPGTFFTRKLPGAHFPGEIILFLQYSALGPPGSTPGIVSPFYPFPLTNRTPFLVLQYLRPVLVFRHWPSFIAGFPLFLAISITLRAQCGSALFLSSLEFLSALSASLLGRGSSYLFASSFSCHNMIPNKPVSLSLLFGLLLANSLSHRALELAELTSLFSCHE